MNRSKMTFIKVLVCSLVLIQTVALGQPDSESPYLEPFYGSENDLFEQLSQVGWGSTSATIQLSLLGTSHLPLFQKVINLKHDYISRVAINTLGEIGDEPALALLRACFADSTFSVGLRIAAAEALSNARDTSSIPLLEAEVAISTDKYIQKYVSRAVERIKTPSLDSPIMELREDSVWLRFLPEDVKRIEVLTGRKGRTICGFSPDEFSRVLKLLVGSIRDWEPCRMHAEERVLLIELHDGRVAKLIVDKDTFAYMDDSYFWHRSHFIVNNSPLSAIIDMAVTEARESQDSVPRQ